LLLTINGLVQLKVSARFSNAILLSLIIHGLLLLVIAMQISWGAKKKQQQFSHEIKKQQTITAQLIIAATKKQQPIPDKPIIPPVDMPREARDKNNKLVENVAKQLPKKKDDDSKTSPKTRVVPQVKEVLPQKIAEDEQPPREEQVVKNKDENKPSTLNAHPISSLTTLERSRAFIRKQASQATVYQSENRNAGMSEMNNSLIQHNYEYVEKSIEEKRQIKVHCDSTLRTVTVAISASLLGGTLRCEPGPDLSQFIQAKEKPKFQYKLKAQPQEKKSND